jgi:hypothetical protein
MAAPCEQTNGGAVPADLQSVAVVLREIGGAGGDARRNEPRGKALWEKACGKVTGLPDLAATARLPLWSEAATI